MDKKSVKDFTLAGLKNELTKMHVPSYRAKQIFFWLYQKGVCDFGGMKNIPRALQDRLEKKFFLGTLECPERLKTKGGVEKFVFKLRDNSYIETVVIAAKNRKTVCLSTQVGCKFRCVFCASGIRGFTRNLTPAEIISQILSAQYDFKHELTNFVFMGMGEPLDNYDNVLSAIMIMNDPAGMGIGARRITLSTCGIIPGIEKLKGFGLQVNLAVSLHAVRNELRDKLVPVNKRYPLEKLIKACRDYIDKRGRLITFEYVLLKDTNDSPEDAGRLAEIAKKLRAKVNLIACSPIPRLKCRAPAKSKINEFMKQLTDRRVAVTLRESKGGDIRAACGQLAGRKRNEV